MCNYVCINMYVYVCVYIYIYIYIYIYVSPVVDRASWMFHALLRSLFLTLSDTLGQGVGKQWRAASPPASGTRPMAK